MGIFKKIEQQKGQGVFARAAAKTTPPTAYQRFTEPIGNFSEGVAKGALSTAKGMSTIGQKILDQGPGRLVNAASGKGFTPTTDEPGSIPNIFRKGTPEEKRASSALTPQGTAQKVGFAAEQAAEFLIPASTASKGERVIDLLSKGITSPLGAAATRIAGKAAVQGLSAGGVNLLQTADPKSAAKTAATVGVIRAGMAGVGEAMRAIKLPERLYSIVFKNTRQDMLAELKAGGIENLRKNEPALYKQFVESGVIKVGANRTPYLNETLAEQALDRALKGSTKSMANQVVGGMYKSEAAARNILKNYSKPIDLSQPQYVKVLKGIAAEYDDVGFGEIAEEASKHAATLSAKKGMVNGIEALEIRRFLDRMRVASSFNRPAQALSLSEANLKTLADSVRSKVNAVEGVGSIMKDYGFYIDALDALAKEAARQGNNQVISLIDSLFIGGAIANPENAALAGTIGILRKYLATPGGLTRLAQLIKNANLGPQLSTLLQAASSGLQSRQ